MNPLTLSVILPTYNESQNVPLIVDRIAKVLEPICSFEVLVIDDNSPDKTWAIAEQLCEERPWLRTLRRMHNKGLSAAVVDGFAFAKGQNLVVMDADLQHDENALAKFVDAFQSGAQLVVGSRKVDGGGVEGWSAIRKFVSWFATRLAYVILPLQVSDPMSGFFGITRDVHNAITPQVNPKGFKILLEYLARINDKKVQEVGYTFRGRQHGESKLSNDVIYDYLEALWGLSHISKFLSWRFLNYCLVGALGMIIHLLILAFLKQGVELDESPALMIAVEASIVSNFFLNNSFTFRKLRFKRFTGLLRGLFTFNAICATGAFINHSLALSIKHAQLANLYVATTCGYVVATVWNYIVNSQICWKADK